MCKQVLDSRLLLWKSPNGCWDYCEDCIHEAINEGSPGVLCIARKGLAEVGAIYPPN
jgi:hypothetical protein